ncbi:hypothetical protein BGZ59_000603 [Podila verticillata]|nr:hypothetical protein BGZ59_000603 [Podila verticillata]
MLHPHPYSRLWSLAASVALILPMVQAQSAGTSADHTPTSSAESLTTTTTTTPVITTTTAAATTTTTTTTTTLLPITTTTTTTTILPITTTTTVPIITTSASTTQHTNPVTLPHFSSTTTTTTLSSTTSTTKLTPSPGSSSSSPDNNVPVIVGSIAGVAALAIILITSISCYRRRRRRANRELTFDALGLGSTTGKRNTLPFTSNKPAGAIGLNSVTSGGYDDDDGYGYDMQSHVNGGYPSPRHNQGYGGNNNINSNHFNAGYDAYGQGVHPTIFNEDQHHGVAAYTTASSMSRSRMGFDQNLPEVMYRNGEEDQVAAAATGYYDDTGYDVAWNQQIDPHGQGYGQGGYVNGLWVANPEGQYYQDQYQQHPQQQQHHEEFYDEPLDPLTPPAPSRPVITSAQSKSENRNSYSNNPQAILPATSAVGGSSSGDGGVQLRSHDLFVETSQAAATSGRKSQSPPQSPQTATARLKEMRSMELVRQSPRPSGEAGRTYADDVQGSGSPTSPGANLNGQKSLRSHRRENWP